MSERNNTNGSRRCEALPSQPSTSKQEGRGQVTANTGRGRGRGQRRGRGRGQGRDRVRVEDDDDDEVVDLEETLHVATMTNEQELLNQKQETHLERILLSNAPSRKRQTKTASPEFQPCVKVAKPLTSGGAYSFELEPVGPSTSVGAYVKVEEEFEFIDVTVDNGAAAVVGTSSPPRGLGTSKTGVQDARSQLDEFLILTNHDSDDEDLDIYFDPIPTENFDAANVPACDSDMTPFQVKILRKEDDANDRLLRALMPDDCTFVWTNDRSTFEGRREEFTGTNGPTFDVTDLRPIDLFDKMIDFNFIDYLCTETNKYAERKIALLRAQNKLPKHSRFHRWTPTDRDEMASFLAVIVLQGLYPLPEEEAYFSFNGFGTMPYFARVMSYNRFLLLKTFLHFVDNQTCQDNTRLRKIRPVIDYFNDKFSSLYMPSQEVVIDESLLKWKGRLSFAQKISTKAAQVGLKTYELCESSSGYLWKFFVNAGKDKPTDSTQRTTKTNDRPVAAEDRDYDQTNDGPIDESTVRPKSATAKIVFDLIEPLLHRGHTVIMDNFYNSPLLLRSLKKRKTDCYGTLRLNREFVPDHVKNMTNTELQQGEVVATYCADLAIVVWRDANLVSMISTYHDDEIGTQGKNNQLTYKPSVVLDYNKNMGVLDRKHQFLLAQPLERVRNRVWYKKVFRALYNVAIFNCFVMFSSANRKMSHRQFRTVLAEEVLKRHRKIDLTAEARSFNCRASTTGPVVKTTVTNKKIRRTQISERSIVESNHFPIHTGSRYTCCKMCTKSRTVWKCEECNINLCIEGCFKAYHKP